MADPSNLDDLTKVGAGGGIGAVVAAVASFFARAQTSARLDAMTSVLAKLEAQLAVLVAASERRDTEVVRLDAERRLAALEAKVEALQRTLDQVVHS